MSKRVGTLIVAVCALAMWSLPVRAQSDTKEKQPLYSYVANWVIPRAQWGEMQKAMPANEKILSKALGDGTLVGYGSDETLVHEADGETHDNWWSSNSMAGLMKVLEQFYSSGTATSPVLASATKHWDSIWVSHYYNWHSGSFKNGYTHVGVYKLKADAPDDAVDTLSKSIVVPILEKLLADGTLHEYEIDEQAVHTSAPGTFLIIYVCANPEGLDKVSAAVRDAVKSNALLGPAFGSMTVDSAHRDGLYLTSATYK